MTVLQQVKVTATSAERWRSPGANFQLRTAAATESIKMAFPPRASTSFTEPSAAIETLTRTVPLTPIFAKISG